VAAGERVVVDPSLSCGACEWCARGEEPLCVTTASWASTRRAGFAEYVVVPAATCTAVPDGYPLETAAAAPLGS
jgi:threonine dehydrogenase-like Zn-dependent dehydrogenase